MIISDFNKTWISYVDYFPFIISKIFKRSLNGHETYQINIVTHFLCTLLIV